MRIPIDFNLVIWLPKEYINKNLKIYGYTIVYFYSQRAKIIINYPEQGEFGVVNKSCDIRADISFYAKSCNK